ncbi:MAG: hypothetical protein ACYDAJ_07550 [Nitrosotalea sp.]
MNYQVQETETYPATQQSNFEEQNRQNAVYYGKEESAIHRSKFHQMLDFIATTNGKEISHDGWTLPATKSKGVDCGKWSYKGCLDLEAHKNSEWKDNVFVKTYKKSCFKPSCEVCVMKWAGREANRATRRIEAYAKISKQKPKHIVVSVPFWEHGLDYKSMKKQARKVLKEVGCRDYSLVFHPFRIKEGIWYYSPHFHIIGFGWIAGTKEEFDKSGWLVKNLGVREKEGEIFQTYFYLLSHCGIKPKNHTVIWFGNMSYSKLKVEEEPEITACPVCKAKLRPIYYSGSLWAPPPETEMELFCNPDGWHLLSRVKPIDTRASTEKTHDMIDYHLYYANKGVSLN